MAMLALGHDKSSCYTHRETVASGAFAPGERPLLLKKDCRWARKFNLAGYEIETGPGRGVIGDLRDARRVSKPTSPVHQ
jgi:hypothetical protein